MSKFDFQSAMKKIFDESESFPNPEMLKEFGKILRKQLSFSNKKIYRYVPADYLSIRSLETEKIYLSPNGKMNDVFEGLSVFENIEGEKDFSWFSDFVYLKSFSENKNSDLMWAHYADQYRGFCVEYDLNLLKQDDDALFHLYPVIYQQIELEKIPLDEIKEELRFLREDLLLGDISEDIYYLKQINFAFLLKKKAWKYEKEWRLIYNVSDLEDRGTKIWNSKTIPFPCVSAVYLGLQTPQSIREHLTEIVKEKDQQRTKAARCGIQLYESRIEGKNLNIKYNRI